MARDVTDGARLSAWRVSLPRSPQGRGMSRGGLSKAVPGWSATWWGKLEDMPAWSEHHRLQVAEGVRAVASCLDVSPETVDACVAHVLDGAPAPQLGPWRQGMCPAPTMGRPRGARRPLRSRQAADEDEGGDDRTPPGGAGGEARPRLMRSVVAILRTQAAGHLGRGLRAALRRTGRRVRPCRRDGRRRIASPPDPHP